MIMSIPRFTLFWRLFLSLLLMLLITSTLSVGIERWLNNKQINNLMQEQVTHLLTVREQISALIEKGEFNSIRQRYYQDRMLMEQVRILDDQGNLISFRRPRPLNFQPLPPSDKITNKSNRQDDRHTAVTRVRQQISVNEDNYPQLADTTALAPNGRSYTIQLQPRLPLREIRSSQRNYTGLRITLTLLLSMLACYWLSRTLTNRIRKLQHAVHHISEGSYESNTELTQFGDDELGVLAREVAQLSERLNKSEKARKRILSDISHELRSPLARLDVATELALDFAPEAKRYLERIDKECGRMNHLIDQIIHIQSLQMNDKRINTDDIENIDILEILESIKKDVSFEFQHKQVHWRWILNVDESRPSTYSVIGNYEQLYSAFENIIRNAFEHTRSNSEVGISVDNVSTGDNKNALKVTVTDAGSGINDSTDLERIFQPFVRLDNARSRNSVKSDSSEPIETKSTGYGLGLSIAHAIITAHHGQVRAFNRIDNSNGLSIEVVLPLNK